MARTVLLMCVMSLLAGCGVGEFFIKRSVLKMESDISKELTSYAKFSDEQTVAIDDIAKDMAHWTRGERLPMLDAQLNTIATEVQNEARLSEPVWRSFVIFMENPFMLSQAPALLDKMSSVIYGMSDAQIERATAKMAKDYKQESQELDDTTPEDQVKKIVDGLKVVLKDLGIKRSREQLKTAKKMLMKRDDYLEIDRAEAQRSHTTFVKLMRNREGTLSEFQNRFREAWLQAEESHARRVPDSWEKNLVISHDTMNYLLSDLNKEQRAEAAKSIRDYAALFEELSSLDDDS